MAYYCCEKKCFIVPEDQVDGIACPKCKCYSYCHCKCISFNNKSSLMKKILNYLFM